MKIKIICVGKIKENYFRQAIDEYTKRLGRYCKLEIVEVKDEKTIENASQTEADMIKEREAQRIIKNIESDSYIITLEIKGQSITSEQLADKVKNITVGGVSSITFIIGGSMGLHSSVSVLADYKLSFSKMTFPHQLMRVILLEQIYRAFKIISNEPYHK